MFSKDFIELSLIKGIWEVLDKQIVIEFLGLVCLWFHLNDGEEFLILLCFLESLLA